MSVVCLVAKLLAVFHGEIAGQPKLDLDLEIKVQALCRSLIGRGLLKSAHDMSHGGLAVAIVESAVQGNTGVTIEHDDLLIDWLSGLFGESQSRIIMTCSADDADNILTTAADSQVPATKIGTVGGDAIRIGDFD